VQVTSISLVQTQRRQTDQWLIYSKNLIRIKGVIASIFRGFVNHRPFKAI